MRGQLFRWTSLIFVGSRFLIGLQNLISFILHDHFLVRRARARTSPVTTRLKVLHRCNCSTDLALDALVSLKNIRADNVHLSVTCMEPGTDFRGAFPLCCNQQCITRTRHFFSLTLVVCGDVTRRVPRYAILAVLAAIRCASVSIS